MGSSINKAQQLVNQSQRIVALTGAGISTPSGIPDFRSPSSGLWQNADPTHVASLGAFRRDPQPFYRWISPLLDTMLRAEPNQAHTALAGLEQRGKLQAIITQNIDGLHQRAGSHNVLELHGHTRTATCIKCGWQSEAQEHLSVVTRGEVPRCGCGGAIKPDVILFDELLPAKTWRAAEQALEQCDLLLVAGTGLEVYPVAALPERAIQRNVNIIIVNFDTTWADDYATVVLREDVAVALPQIAVEVLEG
jgi:NAD-dependent deacetylase